MANQKIELVITGEALEGKRVVAYPYYTMQFEIKLPVGRRGVRVLRSFATVDLIKKTVNRADSIPDTMAVMLDESSILPAIVPLEEAVQAARRKTLFWAFRRYRQILAPEIELVENKIAYHPFFIRKNGEQTILYNAVERSMEKWVSRPVHNVMENRQ